MEFRVEELSRLWRKVAHVLRRRRFRRVDITQTVANKVVALGGREPEPTSFASDSAASNVEQVEKQNGLSRCKTALCEDSGEKAATLRISVDKDAEIPLDDAKKAGFSAENASDEKRKKKGCVGNATC